MGLGGLRAQTTLAVLLIVIEVTLEPVPAAGVLVIALPREDVRGHAVEEPTIVADDHRAAGEGLEGLLE